MSTGGSGATGADAIIIGAGVIGAAIAFELCKRGYCTLNLDQLPAAGHARARGCLMPPTPRGTQST